MKKTICIISVFLLARLSAQVVVTNVNIQPFNLVPEALLNVAIINSEKTMDIQLLTQLFNSSGQVLLSVKSMPFTINTGLNVYNYPDRKVFSAIYSQSPQADYVRSTHSLPGGRYRVCVSLLPLNGADKVDDYCDELEAEFNQYLYLINPPDKDTLDTKFPVLMWTHNEPFSILNQGEFYRMVITEMKSNQTPEEAIVVNSPVMIKNYLDAHQLQYPYDAKELKEGGVYAWQVQKIADGVIINKTEAWSFNVRKSAAPKSLKYVALKEKPDGAVYTAYDGKVYFKYGEEYKSAGQLGFMLRNVKGTPVDVEIIKDIERSANKQAAAKAQIKSAGSNFYDLDLESANLRSGYYTLEVKNEKRQTFYLNIFLP